MLCGLNSSIFCEIQGFAVLLPETRFGCPRCRTARFGCFGSCSGLLQIHRRNGRNTDYSSPDIRDRVAFSSTYLLFLLFCLRLRAFTQVAESPERGTFTASTKRVNPLPDIPNYNLFRSTANQPRTTHPVPDATQTLRCSPFEDGLGAQVSAPKPRILRLAR